MRDDFLSREFVDARPSMFASIKALIADARVGLAALNARQFDAPWRHRTPLQRTRCG